MNITHVQELQISDHQHEILLGTLLGDGHCEKDWHSTVKRTRITIAHGKKQLDYLQYLKKTLNDLVTDISTSETMAGIGHKSMHRMWYLRTRTSSVFCSYRKMFYPNDKKIVSMKILKQLTPLSLAIWYCDDGNYDYWCNTCRIATHGFDKQSVTLIQQYFYKNWNIDTKIYASSHGLVLIFPAKDTRRFLRLIKPHMIESMRYKLGRLDKKNAEQIETTRIKMNQHAKKYCHEHPEYRTYKQQWQKEHRQELNARKRQWRKKRKELDHAVLQLALV